MRIVLLKPVLFSHDQPITSAGTEVEVDHLDALRLVKIGAAYKVNVLPIQVNKKIEVPFTKVPIIDLKTVKKLKGKK